MASTTFYFNDLLIVEKLKLFRRNHSIGISVTKLSITSEDPGKNIADIIHIGGMIFAAREIFDFFHECLDAGWVI